MPGPQQIDSVTHMGQLADGKGDHQIHLSAPRVCLSINGYSPTNGRAIADLKRLGLDGQPRPQPLRPPVLTGEEMAGATPPGQRRWRSLGGPAVPSTCAPSGLLPRPFPSER